MEGMGDGGSGRAARLGCCIAVIALACGSWGASAATAAPPSPAGTGFAEVRPACAAATPREASCFALSAHRSPRARHRSPSRGPTSVDSGAASPGPAGGLTPRQLASAYGYEPEAGGAGTDRRDRRRLRRSQHRKRSGDVRHAATACLPCTAANGCFKKVGQTGSTSALPPADTTGWSVEISLDVETVHAACPKCKILLVEANSPNVSDLASGGERGGRPRGDGGVKRLRRTRGRVRAHLNRPPTTTRACDRRCRRR